MWPHILLEDSSNILEFFFIKRDFIVCVYVCVSFLTWIRETQLWSSRKASNTLNFWLTSPAPPQVFLYISEALQPSLDLLQQTLGEDEKWQEIAAVHSCVHTLVF